MCRVSFCSSTHLTSSPPLLSDQHKHKSNDACGTRKCHYYRIRHDFRVPSRPRDPAMHLLTVRSLWVGHQTGSPVNHWQGANAETNQGIRMSGQERTTETLPAPCRGPVTRTYLCRPWRGRRHLRWPKRRQGRRQTPLLACDLRSSFRLIRAPLQLELILES